MPGTYRLTCAEHCGTNHSQMGITNDGRRAVLVAHEPGGYERYLADIICHLLQRVDRLLVPQGDGSRQRAGTHGVAERMAVRQVAERSYTDPGVAS